MKAAVLAVEDPLFLGAREDDELGWVRRNGESVIVFGQEFASRSIINVDRVAPSHSITKKHIAM